MKVTCPNCKASGEIDDNQIITGRERIRCPQCSTEFHLEGESHGREVSKGLYDGIVYDPIYSIGDDDLTSENDILCLLSTEGF